MSPWDHPSALQRLRDLMGEGLSARAVAAQLTAEGIAVTKSAVISKAHREGLAPTQRPGVSRQKVSPEKEVRRREAEAKRLARLATPPQACVPISPRVADRAENLRISAARCLSLDARFAAVTASVADATREVAAPAGVPLFGQGATSDMCRWPMSGAGLGLHVCGAPVARRAYCSAHAALAYVPLRQRLAAAPSDANVRRAPPAEARTGDLVEMFGESV